MFDLENAISSWKHQFKYVRAIRETDVAEMEQHLRDQVADLIGQGKSTEKAFQMATLEMGGLADAEDEFTKVKWQRVSHDRTMMHELATAWSMTVNYFKVAYRSLLRNRIPSLINVAGMSIALACCVLVFLFLTAWYSMDNYHERGESLFLVEHIVDRGNGDERHGRMPAPLGAALTSDFSQIESTVRINWNTANIRSNGLMFTENITFVDTNFFEMLTFPLRSGSARALQDPSSIIISDLTAEKYFGDSDPVGETLTLFFDRDTRIEVTIAGVTAPFPSNTGFRFGFLMGFEHQGDLGLLQLDDWAAMTSGLFASVPNPEDVDEIARGMDTYVAVQNASNPDWMISAFTFDSFTDPAPDAYLVQGRLGESAHPALSIMFITMAVFMLALSSFNYINIALGSASKRLKEIGMRKVIGGSKAQLVWQFMTENIILCLIALTLGTFMCKVFLIPLFNSLFILQLELSVWDSPVFWAFLFGLVVCVGLISGAYPSLYIASFQPISIFQGRQLLANNAWFTRAFLTFQFTLAFIAVILSVLFTMNSRYLIEQDWGYDPSNTMVVELQEARQYELLRDAVSRHPDVTQISGAQNHIGSSILRRDHVSPNDETQQIISFSGSANYLETMQMRVSEGRLFDEERGSDATESLVINESFVRAQGWDSGIGQQVRLDSTVYSVIGIVEDFTFFLMADPMPVAITASNSASYNNLVLRVDNGRIDEVELFVQQTYAGLFPESIYQGFQQANVYDVFYTQYNRIVMAFNYLSGLALLIACMGLFGLAAQNIARRMKEISIRKVVGASLTNLAIVVNKRFLRLLTIAGMFATIISVIGVSLLLSVARGILPVAHIPIGPQPFLIAYALVFGSALLAIGWHLFRLAKANPADILRTN